MRKWAWAAVAVRAHLLMQANRQKNCRFFLYSRHSREGGNPTPDLRSVPDVFQPCVYLLASHRYGTLYCGVTSDLVTRLCQHRDGLIAGFTSEYRVHRLVWFEQHETMEAAILREKRIKKWNRQWKINLIEQGNPDWRDLAVDIGLPRLPPRLVQIERAGAGSPPSRG